MKLRQTSRSRTCKRRGARGLAVIAAAVAVAASPMTAAAQSSQPVAGLNLSSSSLPGLGSSQLAATFGELPAHFQAQIEDLRRQARDQAWDNRIWLHQQAASLPPELQEPARQLVDRVVDVVHPGLIAQKEAELARARAAVEKRAEESRRPDTGPCPAAARACIDLAGGRTWLQQGGNVTYGPVPMSAGAPSPQTATSKGAHIVNRKVKDEISHEFGGAPMPYSVYFTTNGIAFHQGNVNLLSHGCIHLNRQDAAAYFDQLQVGDMVYVY
ncbi:L,D-transpeptidase [Corynebacterium atypicum]|uniref:L,D-transpeptidase n=1 Tax=Corynebacterium atypicum TaxID=191610 RepID=UPI001F4129C5